MKPTNKMSSNEGLRDLPPRSLQRSDLEHLLQDGGNISRLQVQSQFLKLEVTLQLHLCRPTQIVLLETGVQLTLPRYERGTGQGHACMRGKERGSGVHKCSVRLGSGACTRSGLLPLSTAERTFCTAAAGTVTRSAMESSSARAGRFLTGAQPLGVSSAEPCNNAATLLWTSAARFCDRFNSQVHPGAPLVHRTEMSLACGHLCAWTRRRPSKTPQAGPPSRVAASQECEGCSGSRAAALA